ncbi:hypothetical protein CROQUDRAFT_516765 [Cronartium quercuum f. sp. fusiforme G11]|uniref:Uncharacterized protein n=1 Tax=Cronartium quercuum f. sp. fusiforme G11 TaxID=708437 RepID=A0A9P6TBP0_9BASI|nr:hypothetical protein CROQUDRAFT_516765 [Cronartium quercuum f. sp. fusiforme G11]
MYFKHVCGGFQVKKKKQPSFLLTNQGTSCMLAIPIHVGFALSVRCCNRSVIRTGKFYYSVFLSFSLFIFIFIFLHALAAS